MDLGIENKLAVITGASSGIAKASAKALAAEGARLILTGRDADSLERDTDDIPNVVDRVVVDVTDQSGADVLAASGLTAGGVDILVNTAGITGAKGDPLQMTDEEFRACWEINFLGSVRIARALVGQMVEKGWGRIVFTVSENAVQPYPEEAVYNASKAALLNYTKSASLAYGPKGVLINAVAPAFIETPMTDGMMDKRSDDLGVSKEEAIESFLEEERPYLTLMRRGQPEEVASVMALLCSNVASFTNGSAYRVDGGAVGAMNS
ncbi:NAD(P)-dependent dehydrogenase, short-chain alcohol dehydrogenase family [Cohaesibacter sp. ES.047]|uniref:SDR family NAD(P)-dependent oxidoreductase n=1 Tax=Cohaesibacter sp. ES.047 TaxID=1798205 RepID=UPI000BB6D409|nr:SDR family oxidoreductase [Cohaesibacter sp. ES.047]SNY93265.1 NAD(P)-dependent dehydrogenase, short-chain alcohol dehydrogenase family [Cohaesibacter sp. ES.047]